MSGEPGSRVRLPGRRLSISQTVSWAGREWLLGVGFDRGGQVGEVFLDGIKSGAEFEGLMDDACILLSILLQHGVAPARLADTLTHDGVAGSPIGAVALALGTIGGECGGIIKLAYAAELARVAP